MGIFGDKTKDNSFPSDIVLGQEYIDKQTGYQGIATSVTFFQHACERVCVESYEASRKQVLEAVFDAPRLTHVLSQKTATVEKTGGPQLPNSQRAPMTR